MLILLRIALFSDERAAGFDVARTGVASVGFIGFPSVGKSTLMSKLTGQHSEGMSYDIEEGVTVVLTKCSCCLRVHYFDHCTRSGPVQWGSYSNARSARYHSRSQRW